MFIMMMLCGKRFARNCATDTRFPIAVALSGHKRRDRVEGNSGQTEGPTRAQRFGKGLTDEGDEHCAACVRCISREFLGGDRCRAARPLPLPGGAADPADWESSAGPQHGSGMGQETAALLHASHIAPNDLRNETNANISPA